jgi:hypothetical protein
MDAGGHANRSTRIKFCGETSDRNRSSGKTYRPGYEKMLQLMNNRKEQPLSSGSVRQESASKENLLACPGHGLHGLLCSLVLSCSRLLPACFRGKRINLPNEPNKPCLFTLAAFACWRGHSDDRATPHRLSWLKNSNPVGDPNSSVRSPDPRRHGMSVPRQWQTEGAICMGAPAPDRAPPKDWRGRDGRAGNMGFIPPRPWPSRSGRASCWSRFESS